MGKTRLRLFHTKLQGEYSAHRIAWVLKYGPIPEGMFVLHHCDNTSWVNPAHLSLGTRKDNGLDRKRKGRARSVRGEDSPAAKLNWNQVYEIRARYARESKTGVGYGILAKEYGVSPITIRSIVKGLTWKHKPNK